MKKIIILLLLTTTISLANPFAKPSEAHGILKLNQSHPSNDIFPVKLYEINGEQVLKRENGVWLKPGKHSIKVSAVINKNQLTKSITKFQKGYNRDKNILDITVEEGNIYYVGYDASDRNPNNWKPVVWKTKSL
jgi:nicotinic acid phosphoribosyltransferase